VRGIVRASAASQLLLLVYLEVVEWVPLFPWNDIRRGNGQEGLDVALGILMAAAIFATARRWRFGMVGAVGLYTLWLGLQITTFWTAYIGGASPGWQRIYAANFAATVQWLPRWGTHLPPDANHFVLQLVLLVAFVTTAVATARVWRGVGRTSDASAPERTDAEPGEPR
jgi:hypothetical protein